LRPTIRTAFDVDNEVGGTADGGRVVWEEADGETAEGTRVVDLAVFTAQMPLPAAKTKPTPPIFTADDETP
jgi:hypothetical protein